MKLKMQTCQTCEGTGKVPAIIDAGAQLRELRREQGVGLRQIAEALNLSPQYIADIELGRRTLSKQMADNYLSVLERSAT